METPETAEWKIRERRAAAERRARAFAVLPGAGAKLAARFHESVHLPRGAIVSGYWPLPGELDIRPLIHQIHEAGHRIALPVVKAKGEPCPQWGCGWLEPRAKAAEHQTKTHAIDQAFLYVTCQRISILIDDVRLDFRRGRDGAAEIAKYAVSNGDHFHV